MVEAINEHFSGGLRKDLMTIAAMIDRGDRVLDVGCGKGELLKWLADHRQADSRGIELSREGVNHCVNRGLAVIQGDADRDLVNYPAKSFDTVVLSQTIQATQNPYKVLDNLLNIGHKVIVSIPNFGHWRIRGQLLIGGRMPVTKTLSYQWYDTPNIHLCTIKDFVILCRELNAMITKSVLFSGKNTKIRVNRPLWLANISAKQAIFLIKRS